MKRLEKCCALFEQLKGKLSEISNNLAILEINYDRNETNHEILEAHEYELKKYGLLYFCEKIS